MISLSEVKNKFSKEYSSLKLKFNVLELNIDNALNNGTEEANRPGVYVYWHPEHGVIKVGKSQSNSKKRALEHIRDNTHNSNISMNTLPNKKETILLLFNINNNSDLHWLLSLEAFMELNTYPVIKAGRIG